MLVLPIEKLRAETPGCQHVLHFNNAGAALTPLQVVNAVKEHLDLETNIGGSEAAAINFNKSEQVYENAAKLINCTSAEIAFMENATRAWDMAFYSFKFKPGDRIITAKAEYASNYLAFLQMVKHHGVIIDVIDNDSFGQLDINALKHQLNNKVKLIAITHVPTQGGLINPAAAVGEIANQMQIPYLLDATQSIGQMPIDVKKIGCDFLCATGRKYLRGPRGTGFLYINKAKISQYEPPFIDLRAATWATNDSYILREDARRFETWEQNIAAKIGLGVAIKYALELGLANIWNRINYLASELRAKLRQNPLVTVQDMGEHQCGIVTFTAKNKSPLEIQTKLAEQKINVSISLVEYARLDLANRDLPAIVRASVHYYNTEEEIDRFYNTLLRILE